MASNTSTTKSTPSLWEQGLVTLKTSEISRSSIREYINKMVVDVSGLDKELGPYLNAFEYFDIMINDNKIAISCSRDKTTRKALEDDIDCFKQRQLGNIVCAEDGVRSAIHRIEDGDFKDAPIGTYEYLCAKYKIIKSTFIDWGIQGFIDHNF